MNKRGNQLTKMFEENNKPEYNGWIIFILVVANIVTDDWLWMIAILLAILYVGWIEYLRMKYKISIKELMLKSQTTPHKKRG